MNPKFSALPACFAASLLVLSSTLFAEPAPEAPVPVHLAPTPAPATPLAAAPETQQLFGPENTTLVTPEQARTVVSAFKDAYQKLGSPRIVFYVNRELVEANQSEAASLQDRQTVREVERLFGRVFRAGGAMLADQKVAVSMLDFKTETSLSADSEVASRNREALTKIADLAIEILITSREARFLTVSGEQVSSLPDIQATAIRLTDAAIIAQAAATDILGKDENAARVVQSFGIRDITEATALALMEDLCSSVK